MVKRFIFHFHSFLNLLLDVLKWLNGSLPITERLWPLFCLRLLDSWIIMWDIRPATSSTGVSGVSGCSGSKELLALLLSLALCLDVFLGFGVDALVLGACRCSECSAYWPGALKIRTIPTAMSISMMKKQRAAPKRKRSNCCAC